MANKLFDINKKEFIRIISVLRNEKNTNIF